MKFRLVILKWERRRSHWREGDEEDDEMEGRFVGISYGIGGKVGSTEEKYYLQLQLVVNEWKIVNDR